MDDRTQKFVIFMLFSLGTLAAGYAARKRRWCDESVSTPMTQAALLLGWAPVAMVSFWSLPLRGDGARQLLILMGCQPILMVVTAAIMACLTAWVRYSRKHRGVMILAAGLSNHGFTLGAYLCYALLDPGELALNYAMAFTMSMGLFIVLIFYPIAHHYGSDGNKTIGRLMAQTLISVNAVPLYLSVVGITLNLLEVPLPDPIGRWHVMDILFFLGAGLAYAGIGLRLRLGDSLSAWKMHAMLALVQFAVHPLATWGLIAALRAAGQEPMELIRDVMIVEAFTPTAINVVILSNLFHLDARLASNVWLWNTLGFCAAVLPVLMGIY